MVDSASFPKPKTSVLLWGANGIPILPMHFSRIGSMTPKKITTMFINFLTNWRREKRDLRHIIRHGLYNCFSQSNSACYGQSGCLPLTQTLSNFIKKKLIILLRNSIMVKKDTQIFSKTRRSLKTTLLNNLISNFPMVIAGEKYSCFYQHYNLFTRAITEKIKNFSQNLKLFHNSFCETGEDRLQRLDAIA